MPRCWKLDAGPVRSSIRNATQPIGFNTEGHSFKTLRFFQVIRLCSHHMTFMLMTWKISSIFSTVIAHIMNMLLRAT